MKIKQDLKHWAMQGNKPCLWILLDTSLHEGCDPANCQCKLAKCGRQFSFSLVIDLDRINLFYSKLFRILAWLWPIVAKRCGSQSTELLNSSPHDWSFAKCHPTFEKIQMHTHYVFVQKGVWSWQNYQVWFWTRRCWTRSTWPILSNHIIADGGLILSPLRW